jgi:hypothetical protein
MLPRFPETSIGKAATGRKVIVVCKRISFPGVNWRRADCVAFRSGKPTLHGSLRVSKDEKATEKML